MNNNPQTTRSWLAELIDWRGWLPTKGNVLFTILVIAIVLYTQQAGAITLGSPSSIQSISNQATTTIPYQGRLTDADGNPVSDDKYAMTFKLYNKASDGEHLWKESRTGSDDGVLVTNGLFNVMLGSVDALPQSVITENNTLYLGITIRENNEMFPRVQLGNVPYAVQALTVPDDTITSKKLASDVLAHYSATTPQAFWEVPSCTGGDALSDESWTAIPGLSIDFTLDESKTIWLDFAGLGENTGANHAIFSNIFINGTPTLLASNRADLSGCRNSPQDISGNPWCSLSNIVSTELEPGSHTIDVRVWCDGGSDGVASVYGGTLRALILP